MTQDRLAEEVGISRNYVSQIELGERNPTLRVISDLAAAFGVSASELLRATETNGR